MTINEFPSPQGGSETLLLVTVSFIYYKSFHPLKAGRRHEAVNEFANAVMFPSPQGGSETAAGARLQVYRRQVSIPSRRVGDVRCRPRNFPEAWFPSPQGGSETHGGTIAGCGGKEVSIPSRRVGDYYRRRGWRFIYFGFHPLKAGRRP